MNLHRMAQGFKPQLILFLKSVLQFAVCIKGNTCSEQTCDTYSVYIVGQPAYEMMEADPDWIPSLHLGYVDTKPTNTARSARQRHVNQLRKTTAQAAKTLVQQAKETVEQQNNEATQQTAQSHSTNQEAAQSECNRCTVMCAEVNRLLEENRELRRELDELRISDSFFGEDDDKVKYYTGLPNLATFMTLFNLLLPFMSTRNTSVTPFQILLLTLMRLRLNLPVQHLAHFFRVSPKTVCLTFNETVSFLYANLKQAIAWPDRHTLHKTMPHQFVEAFGHRVAVIIDCFDVFTEEPSDLKAHAQMLSSYNHNHAVKYLIGMTLRGSIGFLSRGWGGGASDEHITLNCGFLDSLLPGDIVLADRGFDLRENVGMLYAEVKFPAFTNGRCQLAARGVEETRKIAHLRTHVERVTGNVCQKYKMLSGTIPMDMMLKCEDEKVSVLDKIVTVCCVLTNQCSDAI